MAALLLHQLMGCQGEDTLLLHMVEVETIMEDPLMEDPLTEDLTWHQKEDLINLIMKDQELIIEGETLMRAMDLLKIDIEVDITLLIIKWIEGAIWIEEEEGHMIWGEVDTTTKEEDIIIEVAIRIGNILIGIHKVIQGQEEILNGKLQWQSKKFHLSLLNMQISY